MVAYFGSLAFFFAVVRTLAGIPITGFGTLNNAYLELVYAEGDTWSDTGFEFDEYGFDTNGNVITCRTYDDYTIQDLFPYEDLTYSTGTFRMFKTNYLLRYYNPFYNNYINIFEYKLNGGYHLSGTTIYDDYFYSNTDIYPSNIQFSYYITIDCDNGTTQWIDTISNIGSNDVNGENYDLSSNFFDTYGTGDNVGSNLDVFYDMKRLNYGVGFVGYQQPFYYYDGATGNNYHISSTNFDQFYTFIVARSQPNIETRASFHFSFTYQNISDSILNYIDNYEPQVDYSQGYASGYQVGRSEGYQEGYFQGFTTGKSNGYDLGYDTGYSQGFTAGESSGANGRYSFAHLFGAIADTPIMIMRNLLGFDVFGVNAMTIVMSMITGCIAIFLIRKFF